MRFVACDASHVLYTYLVPVRQCSCGEKQCRITQANWFPCIFGIEGFRASHVRDWRIKKTFADISLNLRNLYFYSPGTNDVMRWLPVGSCQLLLHAIVIFATSFVVSTMFTLTVCWQLSITSAICPMAWHEVVHMVAHGSSHEYQTSEKTKSQDIIQRVCLCPSFSILNWTSTIEWTYDRKLRIENMYLQSPPGGRCAQMMPRPHLR